MSSPPPIPNTCPQCGAPLSAPNTLCRACLLKRALEPNTVVSEISNPKSPSSQWTPPSLDQLAPFFPDLDLLSLLGRGGMGAVYKARQKSLDRIIALKILPPQISSDPNGGGFPARFAHEAQALAKLNHPHIVTIYDFGQRTSGEVVPSATPGGEGAQTTKPGAGTLYFFLMEFIDGLSLRQLLDASPLDSNTALAIVPQICDALQYAHDRGIVHRDIKPENILLTKNGQIKIADFGLAKLIDPNIPSEISNFKSSSSESVAGTPPYMAPEQSSSPNSVDHRADLYALGVVFYQMLTGELPTDKFQPPSKIPGLHIDVRLDQIILRALEKSPTLRYQNATQFKTEVETIISTPTIPSFRSEISNLNSPTSSYTDFEYRSKATFFGTPFLHITAGTDPITKKIRIARGIIAIGPIARGFVAIGGLAYGFLAIGGFAVGILSLGGLSVGPIAIGGLAIGILSVCSGCALAIYYAKGGLAIAPHAFGGLAVGHNIAGGDTMQTSSLTSAFLALATLLFILLFLHIVRTICKRPAEDLSKPKNDWSRHAERVVIVIFSLSLILLITRLFFTDSLIPATAPPSPAAQLKLQSAQTALQQAQALFNVGRITPLELDRARANRDLAAAAAQPALSDNSSTPPPATVPPPPASDVTPPDSTATIPNLPLPDPIIPQAKPFIDAFQAVHASNAENYRKVFIRSIREADHDWKQELADAAIALKKSLGNTTLNKFTFSYQGDDTTGTLTVHWPTEPPSADPFTIPVAKEQNEWKIAED